MYYVFDAKNFGGEFVAPMLIVFSQNDEAQIRVHVNYARHSDFNAKHTGSGVIPLPPTSFNSANLRYIVVKAEDGDAAYLTDATSPGFMLKATSYDKLPKKYSVPWTEGQKA